MARPTRWRARRSIQKNQSRGPATIVAAATEQIHSYRFLSVAIRSGRNRLFPSVSGCFRCSPTAQMRARIPGTGIENGNKRFRPDTDTNGEKQIATDPPRSGTNAVACAPFNSKNQSRSPAMIGVAASEQIRSCPLLSVQAGTVCFHSFPPVSISFRLFPLFPTRTNDRAKRAHGWVRRQAKPTTIRPTPTNNTNP